MEKDDKEETKEEEENEEGAETKKPEAAERFAVVLTLEVFDPVFSIIPSISAAFIFSYEIVTCGNC